MKSWDFYTTWSEVENDYPVLTWQGIGTILGYPAVSNVKLNTASAAV